MHVSPNVEAWHCVSLRFRAVGLHFEQSEPVVPCEVVGRKLRSVSAFVFAVIIVDSLVRFSQTGFNDPFLKQMCFFRVTVSYT